MRLQFTTLAKIPHWSWDLGMEYEDLPTSLFKIFKFVKCEHDFVEHCDLPFKDALKSGIMYFEPDTASPTIHTVVKFELHRELTEAEIALLRKEVEGHLVDGIGNSFSQRPCATIGKRDIYINPWSWSPIKIVNF